MLSAAHKGHTEVCELLLVNGSDLEERDPRTLSTALHLAAVHGHQSLLELLLSHKADVNSRDRIGATPLHSASQPTTTNAIAGQTDVSVDGHQDLTERGSPVLRRIISDRLNRTDVGDSHGLPIGNPAD